MVACLFVDRALSLMGSRAFLLPRSENALTVGFCWVASVSSGVVLLSHGKPGGEEGGLEARVGSSENRATRGLDDPVSSAIAAH